MQGFTLVELSIVLVIIGLIVGGVLVGQDLITAARIRAQISQIEKYNTAVNTFRTKYNALPGDMTPDAAAAYGFFTRTGGYGDGDGDGYIAGPMFGTGGSLLGGETVLFWTDLSAAGLIDGSLSDNSDALVNATTDTQYAAEMPHAKIGNGNYVYVNGWLYWQIWQGWTRVNGFQIINIKNIGAPASPPGSVVTNPAMTPLESFNIDQKIDDGLPNSGKVIAMYPDHTFPLGSGAGLEINYWNTASVCVLPGPPVVYNVGTSGVSTAPNCSLRFNATW